MPWVGDEAMTSRGATTNNFVPSSEEWSPGRDHTYAPNSNVYRNYPSTPMFPLRIPSVSNLDGGRGANDPWLALEERLLVGPPGLSRFDIPEWVAWEPSPISVLLISSGIARENVQEDSRLTQEEQTRALKKLKKEIYNPVPKKMIIRLGMYYRDRATHVADDERAKEKEEDEKRCAVCLEDFEPKELVTTTPCRHMFHEDCIVPWVKSHGRCPVCRLGLSD